MGDGCNKGYNIVFTIYLNVSHTFYYMAGNRTSLQTQVINVFPKSHIRGTMLIVPLEGN